MIARGAVVSGRVVAGDVVVGASADGGSDTIVLWDDSFGGSSLRPEYGLFEDTGTAIEDVGGGIYDLTVNAGGAGEAFWYNALNAPLRYIEIVGDFDAVLTGRVRNLADSGLPTVGDGNFRIAGLAAHDPDRTSVYNYVHVGWGCTASAGITCEWKSTIDSNSDFGAIAAATGAGQIMLTRRGQIFTAYVRTSASAEWSLVQVMDRTAAPLPSLLQLGMMAYASVASHDIRLLTERLRVTAA